MTKVDQCPPALVKTAWSTCNWEDDMQIYTPPRVTARRFTQAWWRNGSKSLPRSSLAMGRWAFLPWLLDGRYATEYGGSVKTISAGAPPRTSSRWSGCKASPQRTRCESPRDHKS